MALQPSSGVTEYQKGRREYAVLENGGGPLAVFRVHESGRLAAVPVDEWDGILGKGWR